MENKSRKIHRSLLTLVMNIVIIFVCVLLVLVGSVAFSSLRDAFSPWYTEDSMYYSLDDGSFYRMVEGYHMNVQEGVEGNRTMQEYYGVAKYYQAASMYKAFLEIGDEERAARELERMEETRKEMGEWIVAEQEMKEQLGLE